MGRINTLITLLKVRDRKKIGKAIALNISSSNFFHLLSDKTYIELLYRCYFGKRLDLNNPLTFNEKQQWIKLYDRKDVYTKMVDKHLAKLYAAEKIGKEYVIKPYGVWSNFQDIDFDKLPNQFVIKCTHDSGSIVICKNKAELDVKKAKEKIERGLTTNPFYYGREWPYKNVVPKIIIEELLVDKKTGDLKDYKFFCFNGNVRCFKIDFGRFVNHRANYYDRNCKLLPFGEDECPPDESVCLDFPKEINDMIYLAEKLAEGTKFLRVDFYNVDGKIYFGEMTFFPASGFGTFTDAKWDRILGNWINLN